MSGSERQRERERVCVCMREKVCVYICACVCKRERENPASPQRHKAAVVQNDLEGIERREKQTGRFCVHVYPSRVSEQKSGSEPAGVGSGMALHRLQQLFPGRGVQFM